MFQKIRERFLWLNSVISCMEERFPPEAPIKTFPYYNFKSKIIKGTVFLLYAESKKPIKKTVFLYSYKRKTLVLYL